MQPVIKFAIGRKRGGCSMLHKGFSAGIILALAATFPALAADLSAKAPVVASAPVQFSWTGCHIGADIGGAFSDDKIRSSSDFGSAGFIGGGQIGCDYQFAPAWVIGLEGRAAWSSLKSNTPGLVSFPGLGVTVPSQFTVSNDFLASATARLGYSFADHWLVFVRGGAAWTAGAGLEWVFAPHWSASFEYNFYDFGDNAFTVVGSGTSVSGSLKDRIHTVTTGVSYHF
jgi:outer membrane immunogenic protein